MIWLWNTSCAIFGLVLIGSMAIALMGWWLVPALAAGFVYHLRKEEKKND